MSADLKSFIDGMAERFNNGKKNRILAFGSSNTEHFLPGMHWFDCFELAMLRSCGRIHTCINTGVGGNTSLDLLNRFERDAAFYKPHLSIVTIGGNDSSSDPTRRISEADFAKNLKKIKSLFDELNCKVIFQTYYSPCPLLLGEEGAEWVNNFYEYMEIVRKVADETGAGLIDQLKHWEPFRLAYPEKYRALMQDGFHVNYLGNMVMGFYIAQKFGWQLSGDNEDDFWQVAKEAADLMNELEK